MRHRTAARLLGAYLDEELSSAQCEAVELHLEECRLCATALDSMRHVTAGLQTWKAPPRADHEEAAFVHQLLQSLPARSPARPVSGASRSVLLPAGLVLSSAFIQAAAVLTLGLGILMTFGLLSNVEARLDQMMQGVPGITGSSLMELTWAGWASSQLSAWLGPQVMSAFAWLEWLLGAIAPALVFIGFLFAVLVILVGWVGRNFLRGRPDEAQASASRA